MWRIAISITLILASKCWHRYVTYDISREAGRMAFLNMANL